MTWVELRSLPCLRRGLAQNIIDTPLADLEITARKLRLLDPDGLAEAARSGRCSSLLFSVGSMLSLCMNIDVEECEGFNSLIRSVFDSSE